MKTFTKWFILLGFLAVLSYFGFESGGFRMVLENDASYISLVCGILFIGFTSYVGWAAFQEDKNQFHISKLDDRLKPAYFAAEHFYTLGLIGTVLGFCYTVNKALGVNSTDVNEIITQLKNGIGRTLYTTASGLICSLLLQLQLFVVQHKTES